MKMFHSSEWNIFDILIGIFSMGKYPFACKFHKEKAFFL